MRRRLGVRQAQRARVAELGGVVKGIALSSVGGLRDIPVGVYRGGGRGIGLPMAGYTIPGINCGYPRSSQVYF